MSGSPGKCSVKIFKKIFLSGSPGKCLVKIVKKNFLSGSPGKCPVRSVRKIFLPGKKCVGEFLSGEQRIGGNCKILKILPGSW